MERQKNLKQTLITGTLKSEYGTIKCVFCDHKFTGDNIKVSDVYNHYVSTHSISKDDNLLKLYLRSLTKNSRKVSSACPVCNKTLYADHLLYTHVFAKHYAFTQIDFSLCPIVVSRNVSDAIPNKELFTYGFFEERHDEDYDFTDPNLIDIIVKLAVNKHLQLFLSTAQRFGRNKFVMNLVFRLTNKKGTTNELSNPFTGQTDLQVVTALNEDVVTNLVNIGKSFLYKGDNKGSGYQFKTFHSLLVRIKNTTIEFINHFYGGKPKKKCQFIDSEAEVTESDSDDEFIEEENDEDRAFIDDSHESVHTSSSDDSSNEEDVLKNIAAMCKELKRMKRKIKKRVEKKRKKRKLNVSSDERDKERKITNDNNKDNGILDMVIDEKPCSSEHVDEGEAKPTPYEVVVIEDDKIEGFTSKKESILNILDLGCLNYTEPEHINLNVPKKVKFFTLCKSCVEEQDQLLDSGDGSQVICDHDEDSCDQMYEDMLGDVEDDDDDEKALVIDEDYVDDGDNDDDDDDEDNHGFDYIDDDYEDEKNVWRDEEDEITYKLINKLTLLTITSLLSNGKKAGGTDGRRLIFTAQKIINDMPENYFDVSVEDVEKVRNTFLKDYKLTSSKVAATRKTLENNIRSFNKGKQGMCVVNALKAAMLSKKNINMDELSEDEVSVSLDTTFAKVLSNYKLTLEYLKLDDYGVLVSLCKDLLSKAGIVFNIYQYSTSYITTPVILKADFGENEKVRQIPISYLYPVFIGTEELDSKVVESKKIIDTVNLVYDADNIVQKDDQTDNLEIEMKYILDISEFYKLIMLKNKNKGFLTTRTYFCDRCFQLWSSRKKDRFLTHREKCVGKYCIPVVVSKKLYMFDRHDASMALPFTVYYDFETTTGNDYMIPMSYAITFYVNNDYVMKQHTEDLTTYNHSTVKTCWMDFDELKRLNLPDFLKVYVTNSDRNLLRKYARLVMDFSIDDYINEMKLGLNTNGKAMRNYAIIDLWQIELMIVVNCYIKHFTDVAKANSELPRSVVKNYFAANVQVDQHGKENYGKCYVCGFIMETQMSETTPSIIHVDLIRHQARQQHARLFITNETGINRKMYDVEDFVTEVEQAVKLTLKLIKEGGGVERLYKIYLSILEEDDDFDDDLNLNLCNKKSMLYRYFTNEKCTPESVIDFKTLFEYIIMKYTNPDFGSSTTPFVLILLHEISRRAIELWVKCNGVEINAPEISLNFFTEINKLIFQVTPVLDHDHFNANKQTKINGYCHSNCNNKMQLGKKIGDSAIRIPKICIFAHNAKFDQNFFMTQLKTEIFNTGPDDFVFSGNSVNTIKSIKVLKNNISFQDTLLYIQESLDTITQRSTDLAKENIKLQLSHYFNSSKRFADRYKQLTAENREELLMLLTSKGVFPYELFNSHAAGQLSHYPMITMFKSILKNKIDISVEHYEQGKRVFKLLDMANMNEFLIVYNIIDTIQLATAMEEFFDTNAVNSGLNPRNFSSMSQFSSKASLKESRAIITGPQEVRLSYRLESSIKGGYSDATNRIVFDNRIFCKVKETDGVNDLEDKKIFIKVKKLKKLSLNETEVTSKEQKKCLFSTGVIADQVSQYSTEMTKNLTIGRWLPCSHRTPPDGYKDMEDWIRKYDFDNSENGFFFEVIVQTPEDLNTTAGRCIELFNPVLERKEPEISEVSPYQLLRKREASCMMFNTKNKYDKVHYKTLDFDPSTLSRCGLIKEDVFGQLLQYVLNELDFKLVKVLSLHSFKQTPWLRKYITDNQDRRKACLERDDIIGSNSEKLKNNTCFGGHSVSGNRPNLTIIYDYAKECERYTKKNEDCNSINNPWLVNDEHIDEVYNSHFAKAKNKIDEDFNLEIIDQQQYSSALLLKREQINSQRDQHVMKVKRLHTRKKNVKVDKVLEEYQSNKTFKDVFLNQVQDASIKAIVAKNPSQIELIGRAVGSMILQLAKRDISNYIFRVVKLFHPTTRPSECQGFMEKFLIDEIHVYMGATDTDSAKLQILAVTDPTTTLTAATFALEVRRLMCIHMKDMFDLSNEYFNEFGVRDVTSKKKLGTFGFDEINGVATIEPKNQLKLGFYLGPKKYYEQSFSDEVKMKHAGTSTHNQQICDEDYIKDLTPFMVNYVKVKDFEACRKYLDDALLQVKDPTKVRRVVQNMLQRNKNGTRLLESLKVVFSGVAFKRYIMGDGITTLPYGHPLLIKYIYSLNNPSYTNSNYQQDELLLKKIKAEENIYNNCRPLYIQSQLYSTGKVEGNNYDVDFLQALTENKFT